MIPVLCEFVASGAGRRAAGTALGAGSEAGSAANAGWEPSAGRVALAALRSGAGAAAGGAAASPPANKSAATQPETPLPVTGTNPLLAAPSTERGTPGGRTISTGASTLG